MKKLTKLIIAVVASVTLPITGFSQKSLKKADIAFDAHQYFKAVELYKDAYAVSSKDMRPAILYKSGVASEQINDYKSAEGYLQKALAANYNEPDAYYHLAQVLKAQMKYPEAITEYNNYKAKGGDAKKADLGVKSCELAQQWVDNPMRYKIENISLINSKNRDYAPSFSDKKYHTLIITSDREGSLGGQELNTGSNHSDLYETKLDKNGKWSTPVLLPPSVCTAVNEGRGWVSKKGDMIFFTRCPEEKDKQNKCGLYMARKQGSTWGTAEPLPFSIDTVNFGDPCLSTDAKTLYFSSTMSGGYGKSDIWYCSFDPKSNSWGQPKNAGPTVNTAGLERYPAISDDSKKFYFSSNYHPGLGGLDMFVTEVGTNGSLNKPVENLKYPLNSSYDDFGIVFEAKKNRGYFTSNREGGKGDDDIWSFVLPPLTFKVLGNIFCEGDDAGKGKGEMVESVRVKIIGSDGSINEVTTSKDGSYYFKLKEKNTYTLSTEAAKISKAPSFSKDGFLNNKDVRVISTVGESESKEFKADFAVKPVVPKLRMPQILYELGSDALLPESKDSLNYLYNILKDNPTIIVELDAHTDSQGKPKSNMDLSQRRAQSCVNYLVNEKGINLQRLIAKGFGQTQLLVSDAQIKGAASKQEKDALHARNRRTEFKVLSFDFIDPNAPKSTPKPTKKSEEEEEEE